MKHKATIIIACLFCSAIIGPWSTAQDESPRNILLLISDDHGRDLGCYGNDAIQTPHLDHLASEGTRFTHAFAAVSSCSPSRSTLFTGLYVHTNGQYGLAHNTHAQKTFEWVRSLPRVLAESDQRYRTGLVGKFHVQPEQVYPFDYLPRPSREVRQRFPANRNVAWMADAAGRFMRESSDHPFFLVVAYSDPHRGGPGDFSNKPGYPGVNRIEYDPGDVIVPQHLPDIPQTRQQLAAYYQSVSRMDQGVGMVLDELREAGEYDDTLIIYLSDNGIPFIGAKTTLYEPGIRLPLIVRAPNQANRGGTNNAMVSWIDIMPTILDWAGVSWPPSGAGYDLPGRSVLPILDESQPTGWDTVFASHVMHEITMYYPMRVVRTRGHKLIMNIAHELTYPTAADLYYSDTWQYVKQNPETKLGEKSVNTFLHRPKWELYDLNEDPHELRNVATEPAYEDVFNDLKERLRKFQRETDDPWVHKYVYE